jgi:hypothetical protein
MVGFFLCYKQKKINTVLWKIIVPFVLLFSVTFTRKKKVYYTEDFKELSTAEGAAYYSTSKMIKNY